MAGNRIRKLVEKDIRAWVKDFVDLPNPNTNNLKLCPFAQSALDKKEATIHVNTEDDSHLFWHIHTKAFNPKTERVRILADTVLDYGTEELHRACDGINRQDFVRNKVLMGFHPDESEEAEEEFGEPTYEQVEGVVPYSLVFIQRLDELHKSAVDLNKLKYYKDFPPETFQKLVIDRKFWYDRYTQYKDFEKLEQSF